MMKEINALIVLLAAGWLQYPLLATNGMQLEGYGPIAHAMGGTSVAFDNGTAAVINNPATLSLADYSRGDRFDFAFGYLGPDVASSASGVTAKSREDAYFMPAFGWARSRGDWVFGMGVFAQGGMGTEYGADSFLALGSGTKVGAEVSFGRILFPLSYRLSEKLTIGGSIDLVRATMDIRMAIPAMQALGMIDPARSIGLEAISSMLPRPQSQYVRLDFADSSPFTGESDAYGWAAKLGFTYEVNAQWAIGAVYNSRTHLSHLKTHNATFSIGDLGMAPAVAIPGDVRVIGFEWPESFTIGVAYRPGMRWLLTAEWGQLRWSTTLEAFEMEFRTDGVSAFFRLPQNWADQDIFRLGAEYAVSDRLKARAGFVFAENPIPEELVNPLFPATPELHYTCGVGWQLGERTAFHLSLVHVPEKRVTNADGIRVSHGQTNAQMMLSTSF